MFKSNIVSKIFYHEVSVGTSLYIATLFQWQVSYLCPFLRPYPVIRTLNVETLIAVRAVGMGDNQPASSGKGEK